MDPKVCDFLREVDEIFTRGTVNEKKFNNFKKCHSYCPHQNKCTNDYERINALGSYLFNKIHEFDKTYSKKYGVSKHIEIFMIWLGSKSFKMDNDYKATLEEYYKNHLENIMVNAIYWKTISKNFYKNATIRKMDELYSLLDNICKLITEYNKKPTNPNRKSLGNHAVQCRNFYKTIHKSINGCRPYLHLLDNVKMMYENFRWNQIVNNNNLIGSNKKLLLNSIQPLTTFNNENQLFVPVAANFSFGDKECKEAKSNDEKIGEQIALKKSQDLGKSANPARRAQIPVSGDSQRGNPGSLQLKQSSGKSPIAPRPQQKPGAKQQQASQSQTQPVAPVQPPGTQKSDPPQVSSQKPEPPPASPSASSKKDTKLNTPQTGKIHKNGPGGPSDGKGDSNSDPGVKSSGSSGGQDGGKVGSNGVEGDRAGGASSGSVVTQGGQGGSSGGTDVGKKDINPVLGGRGGSGTQLGTNGGQRSPNSGIGDPVNGTGGQGVSDNQTKHSGDSSHGNSVPASSGEGTPQSSGMTTPGTTPSAPVSQPQPQQKPADPLPTDPPPQPPTADPAPPVQDGRSSQTSQTGGSSNSEGGTGDIKDNKGDTNDGSKDPGDGSRDPASNTSGGSFNLGPSILNFLLNGTEKLNKTSQFIEQNQKMFKDAAEKISGAYNQARDNLKTTYDQSNKYLNKLINDVIDQFNKNNTPSKSNDKHPGPGSPMGGGNKPNQSPSNPPPIIPPASPTIDPPSNPAQNPQPTTQIDPTPQKQPSPQPQPPQANPFTHKTTGKAISQLVKSLSFNPNLKKTWNIFPTTWNGSGDCKPEIKFMNATLVCCTSEQCSLTGILITLVLIPIILSIAYKYLSFGLSKKSEKKNMKKVINFHDGNRKTKIIISSCDKKKDLKPVINSVSGKKDSLLNIYKLIQADPMPFINLFFLLIFFVYKRKRDTIE
ncbi:hypothetical protein YYG_02548 [Plasmodium vinckei petteri]|uniref:PIR protein CIR protein n=1 Tax=Plasmodium vinckei petteri TaxID=138298 RepID=W7AJA9_PLAVN|nr:hypothetical protein YYG_02548 [Plasmodium vinckei petteri]CAD2102363.1 PIR protein CIR protein [Plasmodium vinckei petteri]